MRKLQAAVMHNLRERSLNPQAEVVIEGFFFLPVNDFVVRF